MKMYEGEGPSISPFVCLCVFDFLVVSSALPVPSVVCPSHDVDVSLLARFFAPSFFLPLFFCVRIACFSLPSACMTKYHNSDSVSFERFDQE